MKKKDDVKSIKDMIFYSFITIFLTIILTGILLVLNIENQKVILVNNNGTEVMEVDQQKSQYEYRVIHLDNNNFGEHIEVVEYMCTDGVEVNNIQRQKWFYASTWRNSISKGDCIIKIKNW